MSGVNPFMSTMLNMTPSVNPEKARIKIVKTPARIPKMTLPVFVKGEVTGSVAINIAPNKSPPDRS